MKRRKTNTGRHLSMVLCGFITLMTIGMAAQPQRRPPSSLPEVLICYPGESDGRRDPRRFEVAPVRNLLPPNFAGAAEEAQIVFDKLSEFANLDIPVYLIPIAKNSKVPIAAICPANNGAHYIVYDPEALKGIYSETNNLAAIFTIIAHEIGHFALSHDRIVSGTGPQLELRADEYAGKLLGEMSDRESFSLDELLATYRSRKMRELERAPNYPALIDRQARFEQGWNHAAGTSVRAHGKETAGFNLICDGNDTIDPGESATYRITVNSFGYQGPVTVSLTAEQVIQYRFADASGSRDVQRLPAQGVSSPGLNIPSVDSRPRQIRIETSTGTPRGSYLLTFWARGNGHTVTTQCNLYVGQRVRGRT